LDMIASLEDSMMAARRDRTSSRSSRPGEGLGLPVPAAVIATSPCGRGYETPIRDGIKVLRPTESRPRSETTAQSSSLIDEVEQVFFGGRLLQHPNVKLGSPRHESRRWRSGDEEDRKGHTV
jgi:hypothetical protein